MVHVIRAVTLHMLILPYPKDDIWFDPGLISTVPFDPTTDYFYSGHIATLVLSAIILYIHPLSTTKSTFYILNYSQQRIYSIYLAWPLVLVESFLMICLRAHYSIGIF